MVKNGNWQICQQIYTLVLTSSGLEWQLADLPADLPPPTPVLTPSGQNGNFTLLLTFCGQKWQLADLPADLPLPPPHTDI